MATATQPVVESGSCERAPHTRRGGRRTRTVEEKRRIVEQTLRAGASVTVVARAHGVNRDQVFHWRRQYREGRLVALPAGRRGSTGTKLLRVRMAGACAAAEGREVRTATLPSGTMQIELAAGTLRLTGRVDGETLRVVLEALRA